MYQLDSYTYHYAFKYVMQRKWLSALQFVWNLRVISFIKKQKYFKILKLQLINSNMNHCVKNNVHLMAINTFSVQLATFSSVYCVVHFLFKTVWHELCYMYSHVTLSSKFKNFTWNKTEGVRQKKRQKICLFEVSLVWTECMIVCCISLVTWN